MTPEPSNCPDCHVAPDNLHTPGCDVARCAETGLQRLGCDHLSDACNTTWTGLWPGDAECYQYGFLIQPGPDAPPDTPPLPDINRLYLECDWDPNQQRMIRRTPPARKEGTPCP